MRVPRRNVGVRVRIAREVPKGDQHDFGARTICPHAAMRASKSVVLGAGEKTSFVPASTITTEVAAGRFGNFPDGHLHGSGPPIPKSVTVFAPASLPGTPTKLSPHPGGRAPISPHCPSHLIGVVCHASRSGHLCVQRSGVVQTQLDGVRHSKPFSGRE
jgi:hypothetical protein